MKLYALCDAATLKKRGLSLDDFLILAKKHKADVIQYRDKEGSLESIKKAIVYLRQKWDEFLIVNDKIELVEFCDGVHIGQEDLLEFGETPQAAVTTIRSLIQYDKILGLSTHNQEEIEIANTLDLNYIGLGAYRETGTKDVPNRLGNKLDKLAALSKYPVAAIGGVRLDDMFEYVTYRVIGSGLYEH